MLAKAASVAGGTADGAGEVISYTIDVTNDGNSAQADPVVSDPSVSDLAAVLNLAAPVLSPELGGDGFYVGDTDQDGILDAGESWSFFNVGDLDQNGVEDLGETFEFRNSGDTSLDVYGHVGDGRINVGETWHYTASHTLTQDEIDNGGVVDPSLSIHNTATVTTAEGATDDGDATVPIVQNPHVKLTKAATVPGGTADAAGEVIDYTITVENDGNMTLTNPVVSDPSTTGVTGVDADNDTFNDGDTNLDGKLSLGETWHYTASHEVTQEEMDAGGTIDNTASVTTDQEATADGSASVTVEQRAGLTLEKMGTFVDGGSEPNGYADAGETVHYTFTIENDGNVTLSNLVLTDSLGLELIGPTGDLDFDGLLDVGETWTFEGDDGITADDIAAGTVHNEATATADGPLPMQTASDTDSADTTLPQAVTPNPNMTLEKIALGYHDLNNNDVADLGDIIDYSFIVTNTGNVTLHNIGLTDPDGVVNPSGSLILSLAVGASDSGATATHTIDSVDVGRGYFDNTAVAAGDEISVPSGTVHTLLASLGELM
jgi:uncharacterized repeat protein (TIGR01451 family)